MRTRRATSRTVSLCPLLYRSRNRVERFFNKLKHFRAVATRYDKDPDNYLVLIAKARLNLNPD